MAFATFLPILPAIFPFGGVFGALAVEQGLSSGEVFLASMTIFAGASQYAMLDLMGQNVPAWSIVLAVFCRQFSSCPIFGVAGQKACPVQTLATLGWYVSAGRPPVCHGRYTGRHPRLAAGLFSLPQAFSSIPTGCSPTP